MLKSFLTVIISLLLISNQLFSQLSIDTTISTKQLVEELFCGKNSGLIINNVTFTGCKKSIGYFNFKEKYLNYSSGIIISTGNVFDAIGPNEKNNKGSSCNKQGDKDIRSIARYPTFDAAVLEFDITSTTDSISLLYSFASEEYPEFIGRKNGDVAGIFLSGPDIIGKKNLAFIVKPENPVCVDNVNSKTNSRYFIENKQYIEKNFEYFQQNPEAALLSSVMQYDGITKPLLASCSVIPLKTYHLKIVIADVDNNLYDSAILLHAFSLTGTQYRIGISDELVKSKLSFLDSIDNKVFYNEDTTQIKIEILVDYASNTFEIPDSTFRILDSIASVVKKNWFLGVNIYGYTNELNDFVSNVALAHKRAENIAMYFINKGVSLRRLNYLGVGNKSNEKNLFDKHKYKNCRIEIVLRNK